MGTVTVFFGFVIVLELILLAGIVFVFMKLREYEQGLFVATTIVYTAKRNLGAQLRAGQVSLPQVINLLKPVTAAMPWWARMFWKVTRWVGKINPQTS